MMLVKERRSSLHGIARKAVIAGMFLSACMGAARGAGNIAGEGTLTMSV